MSDYAYYFLINSVWISTWAALHTDEKEKGFPKFITLLMVLGSFACILFEVGKP